ncbi:MAG: hypothetical protein EBY39_03095 [Flavobacteriia bacterium]|nr:hypothetical protein [Flavobacteriia bacterium]
MRTELRVFSRLFGKTFKTELSAADDINTAVSAIQSLDLNQNVEKVRSLQSQFSDQLNSLQGLADEFIVAFDELEDEYQKFGTLEDELNTALNSFEDMAENLGIDPRQSEVYSSGINTFEQAESDATAIVNFQNDTYDTYDTANNLFR